MNISKARPAVTFLFNVLVCVGIGLVVHRLMPPKSSHFAEGCVAGLIVMLFELTQRNRKDETSRRSQRYLKN